MERCASFTDHNPPVVGPGDPRPYEIINPSGHGNVVLLCDLASNAVPKSLNQLGLRSQNLRAHIAWDAGAAKVTRNLSRRFDAPAILSGYSRLVIDCNRNPGHETSIPASSDGIVIPGNQEITPEDAASRVEAIFDPYHHAVATAIKTVQARGTPPVIIGIHSFTPELDGIPQPWHISVLWDNDPRIAVPLLAALRASGDLTVGENQPYSGREQYGYSANVHATDSGLPNAAIEIREDQIQDASGIDRYSDLLGDALDEVLADPGIYRVENY